MSLTADEEGERQAFITQYAGVVSANIKKRRTAFADRVKAMCDEYMQSTIDAIDGHEKALSDRYTAFKQEEDSLNQAISQEWRKVYQVYAQIQEGIGNAAKHLGPLHHSALQELRQSHEYSNLLLAQEEKFIQECRAASSADAKQQP